MRISGWDSNVCSSGLIFWARCPKLKPAALICSNTSSISITRLAAVTDRPAKFMGMHFMNPVPLMQLVELIRGIATDEPTFETVRQLSDRLGKTTATAEDFPAFIVPRILQIGRASCMDRGCQYG